MLRPMLSSASGCSVRMHCRQFTAGPLPARTASLLRPTLFRRNVLGSTLLQDHDQPPPHHQQKLHVPPQFQQHSRSMADYRRPPRRAAPTRVREEERDEERTTQSSLERQQQDGMQAEQPRQASASKHDTGMAALQDTGCRNYMINIYTTMGGCIGVSAVASTLPILGVLPMMPPFYMGLASMIPMMYLMYRTDENTNPVLRTGVLALFAGMQGLTLAPAILTFTAVNPLIVPTAFGLTCLMYGGATVGALMAPSRSMLFMAPILGGGAMIMLGVVVLGMFVPSLAPVLFNVWLYGGLALATAFTAFDTQNAVTAYEEGDRDPVNHAVQFFINFVMMFRHLLFFLGISKD